VAETQERGEEKRPAPEREEKRVTWAELFFDLVFVFAVTQVSELLHHDHAAGGLLRAAVVFVPVWWAWVGTSVYANSHDMESQRERINLLVLGLGAFVMAVALPYAYGSRGLLFAGAYAALRLVMAWMMFGGLRMRLNPFSVSLCVSTPLLLAGGMAHGGLRLGLWAAAAVIELSSPAVLRHRLASLRYEPSHLPERFGLFVLIALGESLVVVGKAASGHPVGALDLLAVGAAFVLAGGLWWTYFGYAAAAVRYALATAKVQTVITREVFVYGHLAFVAAIITTAVGLEYAVVAPAAHLSVGTSALLAGGCAVYLLTFNYTRWRMFGMLSPTRGAAGLACAAVIAAGPFLPAVATVALLAAVLVTLNLVEHRRVERAARAASGASATAEDDAEQDQDVEIG